MRRITALAAALVGVLAGLVLYAAPASAHATLVTSTPGDGARLKSAPASVSITFDEPVSIGYLHVTDPSGERVEAGPPTIPAATARRSLATCGRGLGDGYVHGELPGDLGRSHPVAGTIAVRRRQRPASGRRGRRSTANPDECRFDGCGWISYGGLALLGGASLLLTIWPEGRDDRRARRIVWAGWGAARPRPARCSNCCCRALTSPAPGSARSSTATSPDGTLHTTYGQLHCVRLVLLGVIALALAALAAARGAAGGPLGGRHRGAGLRAGLDVLRRPGTPPPPRPTGCPSRWTWHTCCAMATWVGGLGRAPRRGVSGDRARGVTGRRATRRSCGAELPSSRGSRSPRDHARRDRRVRRLAWHRQPATAMFSTTYGLLVVTKVSAVHRAVRRRQLRTAGRPAHHASRRGSRTRMTTGWGRRRRTAGPAAGANRAGSPRRAGRGRAGGGGARRQDGTGG